MTSFGLAAEVVLRRINGKRPPIGTGPLGASGGTRWVSVADVLVWNSKVDTNVDTIQWNAADDAHIRVRSFSADEISLRDYQVEACNACTEGYDETFKSGCIEMGCGDGKSRVAAELIRRSCAPAVILAPHTVCVDQWVQLVRTYVTSNVITLNDARTVWKYNMPLPDVVVTTYNSIVRISKIISKHREAFTNSSGECVVENPEDRLAMMFMCERFGILIMDEVHMAVADHFMLAGCLRCSVVLGLSGSLIREDERIGRLMSCVGPTLYSHFTPRNFTVTVATVPMSTEHKKCIDSMKFRSRNEQSFRALNPFKMYALDDILYTHLEDRVIVFCDVTHAADVLHATHPGSFIMTGRDDAAMRDFTLHQFRSVTGGVLICTRICDASINFPPGCVVVQYHVSNASRQQEVQRCGRGTRGEAQHMAYMYHIVNDDGHEINYVSRRVQHLYTFVPPECLNVVYTSLSSDVLLTETQKNACRSITTISLRRASPRSSSGVHTRINKLRRNINGQRPRKTSTQIA